MIDGSGDRRQPPRRAGAGGTGRVIGKEKSTTETRRHFACAEPKKLKNQRGARGHRVAQPPSAAASHRRRRRSHMILDGLWKAGACCRNPEPKAKDLSMKGKVGESVSKKTTNALLPGRYPE